MFAVEDCNVMTGRFVSSMVLGVGVRNPIVKLHKSKKLCLRLQRHFGLQNSEIRAVVLVCPGDLPDCRYSGVYHRNISIIVGNVLKPEHRTSDGAVGQVLYMVSGYLNTADTPKQSNPKVILDYLLNMHFESGCGGTAASEASQDDERQRKQHAPKQHLLHFCAPLSFYAAPVKSFVAQTLCIAARHLGGMVCYGSLNLRLPGVVSGSLQRL